MSFGYTGITPAAVPRNGSPHGLRFTRGAQAARQVSRCTPEWVMVLYEAPRDSAWPANSVARFPVYSKTPETVSEFKCYTSGWLT